VELIASAKTEAGQEAAAKQVPAASLASEADAIAADDNVEADGLAGAGAGAGAGDQSGRYFARGFGRK
jgi:hypothetical protein